MPKISELTAGTTPTGAEKIAAVQGTSTVRLLLSQVLTYIAGATKTLTNTTFDTAGSGNSLSINGVAASANTGTGSVVRATSPTLVTPALGTPSAVILTNGTGLPIATGVSGLAANVAAFLATPSSANLAASLTDKTGSGAAVFATSPTLVTPALGTPSAAVLTNATGLPIATGVTGLGSGVATFLATPSSTNLAAALTDETGTGSAVFATSPALTTPIIAGITSGTPPAAGKVGEIIRSTVAVGSKVSLTVDTDAVWNTLPLTAGIWLVGGSVGVILSAGSMTHMHASHGNAITTIQTVPTGGTTALHVTTSNPNGWLFPFGVEAYNLSGSASINAVVQATFTGGTAGAYGTLWGLRIA